MIWDIDGVWYSMPISDFAAAVIAGVVMMWYMNKLKRQDVYKRQSSCWAMW